ncbi:MAG TPA: condensation domain-containing protein [Streptosporangiaceae bacterium]|nr:condensation domain-containing protein [Streptosporangiaceae bacterium]
MPEPSRRVYPVTYEQEAIWLHDRRDPAASIYLESWACRLRGTVDPGAVEWAVSQVVARHPALHSGIDFDGEQVVQFVREDHTVDVERLGRPELPLGRALEQFVRRPLDVSVSPLRVTLLELAPDDAVLLIQLHHLVADDWALAVLEREFAEFYCARTEGRAARLAPLPLTPGEYATAQRAAGVDPSLVAYWREILRNAPGESTVPPDRQPPESPSNRGGLTTFEIEAALGGELRALARRSRTTPFVVLAAAVTALLWACNGSAEQIVGAAVSRRGMAGLDQMITCLTGILPLRQQVSAEEGFGALVASTKQVVTSTVAHRDLPFPAIVSALSRPRNLRRPPLCQVVLVVDDVPRCDLALPGVTAERLHVHTGIVKVDLGFTLVKDGDGYQGRLVYASDLFRPESAARLAADFRALLAAGIAQPDLPLSEVIAY